jgi:hypothetical protein
VRDQKVQTAEGTREEGLMLVTLGQRLAVKEVLE